MKTFKQIHEEKALAFELSELDLPDISNSNISTKMGTFDGYEVIGTRFNQYVDCYSVANGSDILGVLYVSSAEEEIDGKKFVQIQKIWVNPDARGRGVGASLIAFVVRKLKTPLKSNDLATDDEIKFYKKLMKSSNLDFTAWDRIDKQKLSAIPDDIFSNGKLNLLIERDYPAAQDGVLFEDPTFKQYRLFVEMDGSSAFD